MPLTKKGRKIRAKMRSKYGTKKGDSVFYTSINKGIISGVEEKPKKDQKKSLRKTPSTS